MCVVVPTIPGCRRVVGRPPVPLPSAWQTTVTVVKCVARLQVPETLSQDKACRWARGAAPAADARRHAVLGLDHQ